MPDEHKMLVWLNEIQQYRLPRWEELPDIELYLLYHGDLLRKRDPHRGKRDPDGADFGAT